jgi:hypothetical protein
VAAERQVVDAELVDRDRDLAHRLHGVAQHRHAARAATARDLGHRLQRAELVVGEHQADQSRVVPQRPLDRVGGHHPVGVRRHARDRHPHGLEPQRGLADRRMLERRENQMAAVSGPAGDVEENRVVRLGAGPGEHHLGGLSTEQIGDARARPLDRFARRLAEGVGRGRVAEGLAEPGQHGLAHPRIERRGGVVVEIDGTALHDVDLTTDAPCRAPVFNAGVTRNARPDGSRAAPPPPAPRGAEPRLPAGS